MMDKIAIFCSASENIEPVFFEKARELGVWMGQNKKTLVYGGANTLDEVFHVMAAATLDYHRKKVIFYNINGFWNGIIDFLAGLERQHFAHHPLNSYFAVANDLRELTELLK